MKDRETKMDYIEELAQRIVEAAMPDLSLQFNVDQSSSVADFLVKENGEVTGVLEVTRSTVQDGEELREAIRKKGPFVKRKYCDSDWNIQLCESARVNKVRSRIDEYLRRIELAGMDRFFYPVDAHIEPVRRIWNDLCVEFGTKTKWKCPSIGISTPSSGGYAESESVWKAVKPELYKADNLKKLSQSHWPQRHLFIYIDGLQGPAYVSIRHCEPPSEAPDLPPEISHLWLVAEEGSLVYVWLASANGWQNLPI